MELHKGFLIGEESGTCKGTKRKTTEVLGQTKEQSALQREAKTRIRI